jgi:hypothetical protein
MLPRRKNVTSEKKCYLGKNVTSAIQLKAQRRPRRQSDLEFLSLHQRSRFFLTQYTKTRGNTPNFHYMAIKYTK